MSGNKAARHTKDTPVETSTAREESGGACLWWPRRGVYNRNGALRVGGKRREGGGVAGNWGGVSVW